MDQSIVRQAISVAQRSVVIALAGAFLLAAVGLIERAFFESHWKQTSSRLQHAGNVATRIAVIDERLTLFSNMAVASGDKRWITRYEGAIPLLERALTEAESLAPAEAAKRFSIYGRRANDALVRMEREAMELSQQGRASEGTAILNSTVYATEKISLDGESASMAEATRQKLRADIAALSKFYDAVKLARLIIGLGILWFFLNRNLKRSESVCLEAEDKIVSLAMHDDLTGLYNRRAFSESLGGKLPMDFQGDEKLALVSFDIVGFRQINNLYGHIVGDTALATIAKRLAGSPSLGNDVYRLGGDEFAVLTQFPAMDDLTAKCDHLIKLVEEPIPTPHGVLSLGARIGVATAPRNANDPQSLYQKADIALQQARNEQSRAPVYYNTYMDEEIRSRARIERELPEAIERGFIIPYFQPVVELGTGRLVGFEALARWEHPELGLIPPDEFISIAEQAGLIDNLFLAILRQACRDALIWPRHLMVSVNLSPSQLINPFIAEKISSVMLETDIEPARLEIEITEDALAADFNAARKPLIALRDLGISVALDDFGTGYSSMRHLSELLVDKIKIDKSFIFSLTDSKQSTKIVKSMLGLARSLGMTTTAEGIETVEQAQRLHHLGCVFGQGYLYAKPMSRLACLAFIEKWGASAAQGAAYIREVS